MLVETSAAVCPVSDEATWPPEARLIMSALEAGAHTNERRLRRRGQYRVSARLRLFVDPPKSEPWLLYTRDASKRGLGFITQHRLPLGYGGVVEIPSPDGDRILKLDCVLLRCRETAGGWFEGAMYFNRDQWIFEE